VISRKCCRAWDRCRSYDDLSLGAALRAGDGEAFRWFWRRGFDPSWRLDETYVKVRGKWTYLYRAVDKRGDTIDFYLSSTRSAKAAKRFLGKALRGLKDWEKPAKLNTDKAPSYGAAIAELKREGKLAAETEHRQVKYLNNVLEADHGKLKC
jgi:transposase-like protein